VLLTYYGLPGYYVAQIAPTFVLSGALTVYFVIMAQMLYPICMAVATYTSGNHYDNISALPDLQSFSSSYTALFLFGFLVIVCSKKDLGIFMRIGSFGVIFIVMLMAFLMAMGFIALGDTSFVIGSATESKTNTDWASNTRTLVIMNANFAPLCGIFCAGYFLHTVSLPIIRASANPEKVGRDVFIGYSCVFVSYAICGSLGYIGFLGPKFSPYYLKVQSDPGPGQTPGIIDQNCLNMYPYDDVPAFILRISIFFLLFSTYPMVNFFLKNILKNLLCRNRPVSSLHDFIFNVSLIFIPLLFALFYPNIGTVLAYVSSVSGFLIIFVFPVLVHLKRMRTKI